ncbi:phosphotransferase family protein [Catellatospora sichuanensis]|uniref:phosphotransferase family protein n=1 Tax=Catellatospora sichuanensis TaxID=1969805 RepID=UPI00118362EA|nr:aminoglycoside phosphotransferase family protein [Catellatospora sichuanensis]
MTMHAYPSPTPGTLGWLRRALGAPIAAVTPLVGGIAHAVSAVDTADGRRYALRRWCRPGWQVEDPWFTPANEVAALTALSGTGLPVPEVVAVDPTGAHTDFPALLMTWLPGTMLPSATHRAAAEPPPSTDMLRQLIAAAHAVHAVDGTGVAPFEPYVVLADARPPQASSRPELWERAIATGAAIGSPARSTLIHRDYHPGNTLWCGGRLTGVVDWTNASRGRPGYDFGYLRVNLLIAHGQGAADALLPLLDDHDPAADLLAFLDMEWEGPHAAPLPVMESYLERLL